MIMTSGCGAQFVRILESPEISGASSRKTTGGLCIALGCF